MRRRSLRMRRSTRREAGDPTRVGARRTTGGCSRASRDRPSSTALRGGSGRARRERPQLPAWRVRSCRRTTGVRSAARPGGPSGLSAEPRASRTLRRRADPRSRSAATTALRASSASMPAKGWPAASDMRPSSPITEICSSQWRRPISKSLGSWPGVIFRAPVPNSGFDVFVGDHSAACARPAAARPPSPPGRVALVDPGATATAVSASIVSGRTVATVIDPEPSASG